MLVEKATAYEVRLPQYKGLFHFNCHIEKPKNTTRTSERVNVAGEQEGGHGADHNGD